MLKKILLQSFLFLIILTISIIFYKNYFTSKNLVQKDITIKKEDNINDKKKIFKKEKSNLIYNIKYVANDKMGNNYLIQSETGELDGDQPELILMTKVLATINLNNSKPLKIKADRAIYNNITYNTSFSNNVVVTHANHIITSNNLDLMFQKNLAIMSNDIVYKNLNTKLQADKVEIDLITKNSKIFMNNSSDKVKIVSIK